MIAMVDCNSFYASCEQVFRPDLWGKPVVVLSNNDGCIIAANKETKNLAHIPMFEPVFKIRDILQKNKVTFFSSNYTLYGEMSQRVMNILRTFSPLVEVYSIDEAFIELEGIPQKDLVEYGKRIKDEIYQLTGLPVGVGIAPTKVLAKVANKIAKKEIQHQHVYVIDSDAKRMETLKRTKIKDVWGIGRKHTQRLTEKRIVTAFDFITKMSGEQVRKEMTVVGERLWRELQGKRCLDFTTIPEPKKAIGTAKSFGKRMEDLDLIEEACAYYISEVSEVLRAQQSCATYVQVFLQTNYHSNIDKQYFNSHTVTLAIPSNNTFYLIAEAKKALHYIFKRGYRYKKVGVNLSGIIPQEYVQGNLFIQDSKLSDSRLMKIFDQINTKYGKSTVASATTGTRKNKWELIKESRSARYTTQWSELLIIKR
ncbi:Y-family DNA polymerase [Zunongwangia sp.]|uniref:Y-family DNA polymerase n=1 Tax=Zunongwangia sp. TaxID=1965325 RepID=UPI003AA8D307